MLPAMTDVQQRGTVLVVDDDAAVRVTLREMLEGEGYVVAEASGGEGALSYLRAQMPSVMLLDLCMPGTDGLAVLKAINADPSMRGVAVVVISAEPIRLYKSDLETSTRAVLPKPLHIERLLETVAQFC